MNIKINNRPFKLEELRAIYKNNFSVTLSAEVEEDIKKSADYIHAVSEDEKSIYGINTGFGVLANVKIDKENLRNYKKILYFLMQLAWVIFYRKQSSNSLFS